MIQKDGLRHYTSEAIDVSYDVERCRHAAECVRGLPAVFDTARRPWILPDGADPADVVGVVARCPTGALRTHTVAPTAGEPPVRPTEITAVPGGPVPVRGDLHVRGHERETRAALC